MRTYEIPRDYPQFELITMGYESKKKNYLNFILKHKNNIIYIGKTTANKKINDTGIQGNIRYNTFDIIRIIV